MNLSDLKLKKKKKVLVLLADLISEDLKNAATEDEEFIDTVLEEYQNFLDNLDGYDWFGTERRFGTEGWRHRVGLD